MNKTHVVRKNKKVVKLEGKPTRRNMSNKQNKLLVLHYLIFLVDEKQSVCALNCSKLKGENVFLKVTNEPDLITASESCWELHMLMVSACTRHSQRACSV